MRAAALGSLFALALAGALLGAGPLIRGPAEAPGTDERAAEDVVLLHGLGRSDRAMRPLERALEGAGYRVHNLRYPSLAESPEELVAIVAGEIEACCAGAEKLHFVTHSLGGLIARAYLAEHPHANLGRVVMLAPPNHGSAYADLAREARLSGDALVPALAALGTDPAGFASRLPEPDFEVGVIAGTKSRNPFDSVVAQGGESDGAVSVESARLAGMRDFVSVDATHASIRRSPAVHAQVLAFLATGHFEHPAAGPLTEPGATTR